MEYSLKELAELTGIEPRTIRLYISEGLVRGPGSRGRGARYSEYHLKRLKAIKRLKEEYNLSLSEIRAKLLSIGTGDIKLAELNAKALKTMSAEELYSVMREEEISRDDLEREREIRPARERAARYRAKDASHVQSSFDDDPPLMMGVSHDSDHYHPTQKRERRDKPPLEQLLGKLNESLSGRNVPRSSRGEQWMHIEITPEISLQVKGEFASRELALFEQIADHMRQILLGDTGEK